VKGYKGFDKNLQCRGHQYEIGKTYETDKQPVRCTENGFHFCEDPLDVFRYYAPADSRFAEVVGDGEIDQEQDGDSKVVVSKLHIGAEIGLQGLIKAGVKFTLDRVKWEDAKESNTGDQSAASAEGKESVAMAIGYKSKAKGVLDCWIVLSEWEEHEDGGYHIKDVQCVRVDGETIKADTWYKLIDGEFVEADKDE
jgi:hypothetical protein